MTPAAPVATSTQLKTAASHPGSSLTNRNGGSRFSRLHVETQEEIRRIRATHKLVCLSRDAPWVNDLREPDRRFGMGWARGRMWDQYDDHHQGVCLVFDRDRLLPLLREQLSAHPGDFREGAVQYRPTGINGTTAARIMLSATDTSTLLAKTHIAKYAEQLFFTKLPDWKEEQEYRFAVSSDSPDHLYVNVGDSLVAFITGCKFSAATDRELVDFGDAHGVPAHAFFWEFNGPWCGVLTGYGTGA